MKIAPLLAEYLSIHKRLDLPGIGSFMLDPGAYMDTENSKTDSNFFVEGARFEKNAGIRESPELVDFIASNTGKQKTLAAADLESLLENARQFLNIGKPFLFEGIGTLSKLQTGDYHFTPGVAQAEKAGGKNIKENTAEVSPEETAGGFKNIFYAPKAKTDGRKTLFIFLLIIGLGLAIWGGYTVYKRTTSNDNMIKREQVEEDMASNDKVQDVLKEDTSSLQKDSLPTITLPQSAPAGQYKFVVEAADKARGLQRYGLLKGFGLPVNMDTKDSVTFHIYFQLPAAAADTSRIRDSLRQLYTPAGKKAFVKN